MWFDLPIEVIPAVDVLGDGAVRLERGGYEDVVERAGDPVALATRWVESGALRLHLVDLDGARGGPLRPELVREIAPACAPHCLPSVMLFRHREQLAEAVPQRSSRGQPFRARARRRPEARRARA